MRSRLLFPSLALTSGACASSPLATARSGKCGWLKHLQHAPLYRAIGVRIDWNRLGAFDDDEDSPS